MGDPLWTEAEEDEAWDVGGPGGLARLAIERYSAEVDRLRAAASEGVRRIAAERSRQTTEEGWTREHDAQHRGGVMARAAACYALPDEVRDRRIWTAPLRTLLWPWQSRWWKPKDRIRDLERAGALIAAEIDRLLDSYGDSAPACTLEGCTFRWEHFHRDDVIVWLDDGPSEGGEHG